MVGANDRLVLDAGKTALVESRSWENISWKTLLKIKLTWISLSWTGCDFSCLCNLALNRVENYPGRLLVIG